MPKKAAKKTRRKTRKKTSKRSAAAKQRFAEITQAYGSAVARKQRHAARVLKAELNRLAK